MLLCPPVPHGILVQRLFGLFRIQVIFSYILFGALDYYSFKNFLICCIFKIAQVCHIAKVTRLISAAAQKLISDVAYDALQVTGWPEHGNLLG